MAVVRTHHPIWRKDVCLSCGACTRRCPAILFSEQSQEDSLRGQVARKASFYSMTPEVAPCRAACPIGQNAPAYQQALARGDCDQALQIILQMNPLPSVCGRLCVRACMQACVRRFLDQPVQIRALKAAAADHALRPATFPKVDQTAGKVAVVGAGPSGLSVAYFLSRLGHEVTVFESQEKAGGLLGNAVPSFDLPREALDRDIQNIQAAGVVIKTQSRIDSPEDAKKLLSDAQAVVIATGAGVGQRLGIPGEHLSGCWDAISFAQEHAVSIGAKISGPAVIAGSGKVALAVARMALRAGANPVTWVIRRTLEDISVDADKLRQGLEEGIVVLPQQWPVEILGNRMVTAVRCTPVELNKKDSRGRRWPLFSPKGVADGSVRELPAKVFVAAEDRRPERDWDRAGVDIPGVFWAGEALFGPRNVVGIIANAHAVAQAVAEFLRGAKS